MVGVKDFLNRVLEICNEGPGYQLGRSGDDGFCDCIGLVIGAIRRAGGRWPGIHGTNYAARNEIAELRRVGRSADLKAGELVFKARAAQDDGYSLPERYRSGGQGSNGDLNDYYHVGIVVSCNPLQIYHMTTPRPKIDKAMGKWNYAGWCKRITEGDEKEMPETLYQATVIGGALNMRNGQSRQSTLIQQIPKGASVDVLQEFGEWCLVQYRGKTGYVMTEFISKTGEMVQVPKKDLEEIYDKLGDWLGLRG